LSVSQLFLTVVINSAKAHVDLMSGNYSKFKPGPKRYPKEESLETDGA